MKILLHENEDWNVVPEGGFLYITQVFPVEFFLERKIHFLRLKYDLSTFQEDAYIDEHHSI